MLERSTWMGFTLMLAACSSEAASESTDGTSAAAAVSASGMLRVNATTLDGEPPARGANPFDIEILRVEDEVGVGGLQLELTPWMPAMGHGTSVLSTVTELGNGLYRADNVYLFMPGLWELRISIDGSVQDDAAPRFQIY